MDGNEISTVKLVNDLKAVVRDAEELVRATASEVGEKAREAREKLVSAMETAKGTCRRLEEEAAHRAEQTEQIIREHPLQSIGAAFCVGLILGILFNRK